MCFLGVRLGGCAVCTLVLILEFFKACQRGRAEAIHHKGVVGSDLDCVDQHAQLAQWAALAGSDVLSEAGESCATGADLFASSSPLNNLPIQPIVCLLPVGKNHVMILPDENIAGPPQAAWSTFPIAGSFRESCQPGGLCLPAKDRIFDIAISRRY
jgi:hypothetical protein